MTPLEKVTAALEARGHPVRNGSARCPAHDDRSPSLTLGEGEDGRALLRCHAGDGCSVEQIVAALGLSVADLFATSSAKTNGATSRIVATYPYTDETGTVLFEAVRFDPKSFRQRHREGDSWVWSIQGIRRPLYNLPRVIEAVATGREVFICEGEKDCEALERAGRLATCNPMGAGKFDKVPDAADILRGAHIRVVMDKDAEGERHARQVARTLLPVARSLMVLEAELGKDAADHLGAGRSVEDFLLVAGHGDAPGVDEWLAPTSTDADAPEDGTNPLAMFERRSADLDELLAEEDPEYDWLVPGLLERGDRLIVTGQEGQGKSTLLRQLGVQLACGIHPFGGEPFPPLSVLIVDAENSRRQVRRQVRRLRHAAGGDYPTDSGACRFEFRPDGLDVTDEATFTWLASRMTANDKPQVLILGPLYKLGRGDPVKEEPALAVAGRLDKLRYTYGCAIVIEAHSPYAEGSRARRPIRPYGASLWSRWPEFGLYLAPDGKLDHWRGPRDERTWPAALTRGEPWPWMPRELEEPTGWDGPRACMAAILDVLTAGAGTEYSQKQLLNTLRATGHRFKDSTVAEGAERLALEGAIGVRSGPRNSRQYSALPEPADEL